MTHLLEQWRLLTLGERVGVVLLVLAVLQLIEVVINSLLLPLTG